MPGPASGRLSTPNADVKSTPATPDIAKGDPEYPQLTRRRFRMRRSPHPRERLAATCSFTRNTARSRPHIRATPALESLEPRQMFSGGFSQATENSIAVDAAGNVHLAYY